MPVSIQVQPGDRNRAVSEAGQASREGLLSNDRELERWKESSKGDPKGPTWKGASDGAGGVVSPLHGGAFPGAWARAGQCPGKQKKPWLSAQVGPEGWAHVGSQEAAASPKPEVPAAASGCRQAEAGGSCPESWL